MSTQRKRLRPGTKVTSKGLDGVWEVEHSHRLTHPLAGPQNNFWYDLIQRDAAGNIAHLELGDHDQLTVLDSAATGTKLSPADAEALRQDDRATEALAKSKLFQAGRLKVRVSVDGDGVMFTTPEGGSCPDSSFSGATIPLELWREINRWLEQSEA